MADESRKDIQNSESSAQADTPVPPGRSYRGPRLAKYGPLREIARAKPGKKTDNSGFDTKR